MGAPRPASTGAILSSVSATTASTTESAGARGPEFSAPTHDMSCLPMVDTYAFVCGAQWLGMAARCTQCKEEAVQSECAFGVLVSDAGGLIRAAQTATTWSVLDRSLGRRPVDALPSDYIPATEVVRVRCQRAARRLRQKLSRALGRGDARFLTFGEMALTANGGCRARRRTCAPGHDLPVANGRCGATHCCRFSPT